jgi:hypothetical protein
MYAADHDGKLPQAANWEDEVRPYYEKVLTQSNKKDRQVFGSMSAAGPWGCGDGSGGKTGMAMNDEVSGQSLSKLEASTTIVLFEIERATQNAHEKYAVRSDANGPKIFGAPRGWFLVRMSGEPNLMNKGRETPVNTGPSGN